MVFTVCWSYVDFASNLLRFSVSLAWDVSVDVEDSEPRWYGTTGRLRGTLMDVAILPELFTYGEKERGRKRERERESAVIRKTRRHTRLHNKKGVFGHRTRACSWQWFTVETYKWEVHACTFRRQGTRSAHTTCSWTVKFRSTGDPDSSPKQYNEPLHLHCDPVLF